MNKLFENKAGFVTGAAGGIGRATAIAFAKEGAKVVVSDLESMREKSEETVRLITDFGGEALFFPTDVSDEESVKALVQFTVDNFGSLNFTHNNAGIIKTGFTADVELKDFQQILNVDLIGVWLCMKHAIKYMLKNGGGTIVNTASEAGLVGSPLASPYVAAKHAVVGLTKTAAGEYANLGIRINAIAPGSIETPMVSALPKEEQEMYMAPQPMHRFGKSDEVADAVLFLSSEKSSFITGITLPIDGGAVSNAQSYDPSTSPSAL
ncbi:glucose 1-dehydrogenase [Epilithonimonas hungarica]|uniref:NAD(P)-dependent dehydrogenase, short-chain alcohol dehydrogenase family n=1 Tax=Epilithonimonas hungarica TaxID=454006 RepID=A0A1G7SA47_9FLAO|nr:glucose 1-dehydrogenase [Epilithonimonas hungarica]SDG19878.1 NAD(P)-dependent dehydrogenase, short-chain alcohol dehydrogenase family [Epilithonimonas hungarica]